ncbi:pyruvate dehydrogenase (acetyl-transferring), homodimeric type [Tuwongella immobilis]|uniref:Pyruvate dehydrogenase E1 component n=1 Tax=Tuwongella immobilis TaxID=692036 RepID=A0A6C2YQZ5_9BACT|nr:pyruvate dehydrogenase (acetyl-transferring), homodimeric type [Tuwongella immobilis]VIP03302.1 pyruvate dehydrogenase : Pyruvate dehydrogenase E1 component OS=Ignavibacterium album (strain DSM 19864 / JCM 16511 / NBRC 101810 / Mat9-16) GN=aceE PE=4 SV=1: Transketolase_N: Transketolase_N [Tuwongella immobilis]VTS03975.1 pyruvate dehydrogenase : Pyruvate dehydrogenase E1 component OS=Ignavibacterium album (strain DSM 19864 / JCM 16511 / NBRC 101810 / Mat9-16) GN=aceE PE=4 SV=1: Transketolase_N:
MALSSDNQVTQTDINSQTLASNGHTHGSNGHSAANLNLPADLPDQDPTETSEWLESLEAMVRTQGPERAQYLLQQLLFTAHKYGVTVPFSANTPYVNTITLDEQPMFPGNRELERKIKSYIRWNAMAMVVKANKTTNVGGHIATFASAATLYEIGFNHFFRGASGDHPGDIVYFQGHASPGMYARAFLEGRLSEQQLLNFRQELQDGGGLSSYPHPWLMPNFWQYPTVSMGLGPIMAIYQARFIRYLQDRGHSPKHDARVWAFLGDGECDEPETLGAITLAAREKLDNLCFVINCNLQRLDGPVRGNGKIIQELEAAFRGAGWNVIKVVWGSEWDSILAKDTTGALVRRMGEVVDGEYQEYVVKGGAFIREKFFNTPELKALVSHLSDEQLNNLKRGGHDPLKVYAAYKTAVENKNSPSVILVKTIKGYGTPSEGKNTAHQAKKVVYEGRLETPMDGTPADKEKARQQIAMKQFRDRFAIPVSDEQLESIPFYRPSPDSPEMVYLHERRKALGGYQPARNNEFTPCQPPLAKSFERLHQGSVAGKSQSTTLAWVNLMMDVMQDPNIGKLIVPIVPDEGQTFGMPGMYSKFGIYSHVGQLYTPVDAGSMTSYRESTTGQILQEGINEAGSMCSFIAAGTAYSTHRVNTIPFYIYYSMFGFQRIGDLAWAAADSRCKGFLMGGTAGRTTLNGEGLQHEDGHSHIMAMTIPNCRAYDPAYGYELAVIIEDGIKKMYVDGDDVFYYLTVYNEGYEMPSMPEGVRDGIIKGIYKLRETKPEGAKLHVQLLGSGVILNEVLKASKLLAEKFNIGSTVYSVTSYQMLRRDAIETERHNRLHPTQSPKKAYIQEVLGNTTGPIIASSDYMRMLPEQVAPYLDGRLLALGTDGFGRSETRQALRRFFEVDAESVTVAALYSLAQQGQLEQSLVAQAIQQLGLDPEKPAPWTV